MPSKVITNDKEQRKGFKERTLERVANALAPAAVDPIVEESAPIEVEIPSNFWELSNSELYGIVRQNQLTPEQVNQVIEQLRGRTAGSKEFKIVLQSPVSQEPEFKEIVEEEIPVIVVELPSNFHSYRIRDQYLYLTKECALSPEHANDVVDILAGKSPLSKVEYNIRYGKEVPVQDFNGERDVVVLNPISITLPHNFSSLKRVYKEIMLTKDYGLSLQEALDVLSVLEGKEVDRSVEVTFEEAPTADEPIEESFSEITVKLPNNFEFFRPQDQYIYLKNVCKFTSDQANDILSAFRGQSPLYNKVIIE